MSQLRNLFNSLSKHNHRRLRKSCHFKLEEIIEGIVVLAQSLLGIGLLVFFSFIYIRLSMPAGNRLWFINLFSIKPRLEEVYLSVTKENLNCWYADLFIIDHSINKRRQSEEIPVLLQICAESGATWLQMFYVDSESVKVPRLHGGSFQKISNEVPCIGGACPPVSISGNYIGIPTTDRFTYETNYYIFLLPTLGLCNHGMVDSQERLDMLWNDVIREFSYHLAICLGACLAWIAYFWNSVAKFINLMQRLWSAPMAVISVKSTARLLLVNNEDIFDMIEDFPSSEPGPSSANNDQICNESPSNASCHPNRVVHRSSICPDLRKRMCVYDSDAMSMDDLLVPGGQRTEVSSDCDSVVSVHQEENRCRPSRPIYQRTVGWFDSGTSDNQTSETSESDDDHMSVTSEDYDTSSDSSFSAVEDTHSPPVSVAPFSSGGVVFEDYSEQTRQDPVGGE